MTKNNYHNCDISGFNFLITGGAGFVGSNLVNYLIQNGAGLVRVLDNLSNGYIDNIKPFIGKKNFEFVNGDIRDFRTCKNVMEGIHYVSHQAALGSVPRSINDPIITNEVNIDGFLNVLTAVKESENIRRMVYAASSSSYGDSLKSPKVEGSEGKPLSPYAVTKLVNELYSDVFSKVYGLHTIGLRYFNIYGPNQNPLNPYAAVIPLFMRAAILKKAPVIFGDGETSRDFTFVENAVQANIKALLYVKDLAKHEVLNIAVGESITLNELWKEIALNANCVSLNPIYKEERKGDVRASLADINKARKLINYDPNFTIKDGLRETYNWYLNNQYE